MGVGVSGKLLQVSRGEGETWTGWRREMAKCVLHVEVIGLADGCNEGMEEKEIPDDEHEFSLK